MAAKGPLNLVELHWEKAVLGLTVLTLIGLGGYFALGPHKVEYGGQKVGPSELDNAIAMRADNLKRQIQNAQPKKRTPPNYAQQLATQFQKGLFAEEPNVPMLPRELRVSSAFGAPLPELGEEAAPSVTVVTPLPPTAPPVLRTGISLVVPRAVELAAGNPATPPAGTETEEPEERSWVSGAVYFPQDAQTREMIAHGYAGYLAKVYVVGVDAQRQEMTANGEWTDWQHVERCKAMPEIEVPTPLFEERTGNVLNQTDLDQVLDLIRSSQILCMQPPFYTVTAGNVWEMPPLPGYEDVEEDDEGGGAAPDEPRTPKPTTPKPAPTPAPGGFRPPGGGGPPGGGAPGFTPPGGGPPGGGRPAPAPRTDNRAELIKQLKKDLLEADKALARKEWSNALQLAHNVANNDSAPEALKRRAQQIIRRCEKAMKNQPTPSRIGELITAHNADKDPACWFHDDSVQPGKTYRYRLRVKLWNRYVGKRAALQDPAAASQTVLPGEWSLPSDPITVAPKTHFFVKGPRPGEPPVASVEVFTWYRGEWYKEAFNVQVGDTIGDMKEVRVAGLVDDTGTAKQTKTTIDFTTGAVVLDLRPDETVNLRRSVGKGDFTYNEGKALVLVYLDPADGQVKERTDRGDRADPQYKELRDEVTNE